VKLRLIFVALSAFFSFGVKGQNDVLFSHFGFQPTYFNPSWNGLQNTAYLSTLFRSQWTGYSTSFDGSGGAPNSQFLSFSIPVKGGLISSIGATLVNDNIGPINNFNLNFPVTLSFDTNKGILSLAAVPGIVSQTQKFDELRFVNPNDPFNTGTRETQTRMNFSLGGFFSFFNGVSLGFSANNLIEPTFDYGLDSLESKSLRSGHLFSSYAKDLTRDLVLTSNLLLKSDLRSNSFEGGFSVMYKSKGWAGLNYRYGEAIIFMIGYSFLKDQKMRVGYALDYVMNERTAKQLTSQEIFINYNLPELMIGGRKQVKTPRFTY